MERWYWIIDYQIKLLSDFHVGAGITLLGGKLHGLRLDQDGFPYLPHTQVRGLLRLGGYKLQQWLNAPQTLTDLFQRNFERPHRYQGNFWSYTRAAFPYQLCMSGKDEREGLFTEQSHVAIEEGTVKHLFSYQKSGALTEDWRLEGRIYAIEPATEQDVGFIISAMRAEDRIGHRRTRGYGKVDWKPVRVRRYRAGEVPGEVRRDMAGWIDLALKGLST